MSQLQPNSQFGSYNIIRHIAGGGMAQIYLAKVMGLAGFEKQVALKVINPEYADEERFIQMLIDEAKITVGLTHVNIGQVFDLGQVSGIYYIAMEFVDGVDVLELVNGLHAIGERVPCEAVALIGRQICSGLQYAHTRKDPSGKPLHIVHRDISPQNILVSRAGEVKVVDFGIAKAAGVSTKTQAGVIKGKVHYMAPEQAMGKQADRRCDIFSTGIVLWEMLTSQMVYSGDNVRELVERVRLANIAPPSKIRPEIPAALDKIVLRALARKTEDRFQTAHSFQVELTKFLSAHAPDFGSTSLAALSERVYAKKHGITSTIPRRDEQLSKDEMIQDIHSMIAEQLDPADDQARLIVETPQGQTLRPLEAELVIGRAGQLAIPDARVSRRHARITLAEVGNYMLEDLGSANGTYVNEEKIAGPYTLQDNDVIRIGSFRMTFRLPDLGATFDARPPVEPVPLLLITSGTRTVEQLLGDEFPLTYQVHVGPARIGGMAGRVVQKQGDFWLEPLPCRQPLMHNGVEATGPVRLTPGDMFQVGGFHFEFRLEPPAP